MRRRDYPKELKIRDGLYGVKFVHVFPPDAGEQPLDGFCCYATQTIYLRVGQKARDRLSTAIHETLHAIDDEWSVGLTHRQVYLLEAALLGLLLDNDLVA